MEKPLADRFTVWELEVIAKSLAGLRDRKPMSTIAMEVLPALNESSRAPTLSKLLDRFEKFINVEIFQRAKQQGGARELNSRGYEKCEELIRNIERIKSFFAALPVQEKSSPYKTLRIGCFTSHITQALLPATRWISKQHKTSQLEFYTGTQSQILGWLQSRAVDVAILMFEPGYQVESLDDKVCLEFSNRTIVCELLPYRSEIGLTFHRGMPGCEELLRYWENKEKLPAGRAVEILRQLPMALCQTDSIPNQTLDALLLKEFSASSSIPSAAPRYILPLYRLIRVFVRQRLAVGFGTPPEETQKLDEEIKYIPIERLNLYESSNPNVFTDAKKSEDDQRLERRFAIYARKEDLILREDRRVPLLSEMILAIRNVCKAMPDFYGVYESERWLRFSDGQLLHDLNR